MKISDIIPQTILKINQRTRYYFLWGILLGVFLLDYFVIICPQLNALTAVRSETIVLAKNLKEIKTHLPKIPVYQAQVIQAEEILKKDGNKIRAKEEVPIILERISRLAKTFNVKIHQITPLKKFQELILEDEERKYFSFPILLEARGGYHDVGMFFYQIETDDIFMNIINFSIITNGNDPEQHLIKLTIECIIAEEVEV